uniref:Histone-lysine N-methyltransferase SETMAR n=1 Tax=Strongyloides venezuelensis TaxID=75913 RepID=A0A0K0EXG9_STRVS
MRYGHTTIARHINKLGYVQKLGQWVQRELNENQLANRLTICSSLLLRQNFRPFLDRLIIGDVKWITYDVFNRKRDNTLSVKKNQSIAKYNIKKKKECSQYGGIEKD